jgi:hypothetical protein
VILDSCPISRRNRRVELANKRYRPGATYSTCSGFPCPWQVSNAVLVVEVHQRIDKTMLTIELTDFAIDNRMASVMYRLIL